MELSHPPDELRQIKADIDQLRAFSMSDIVTPAVRREIDAAIHRVENMISHEEKEDAAMSGQKRGANAQIDLYYDSGTGMHPLGRVLSDYPVSHVKKMLMGKSIFFQSCERVRIERTGEVISLYSNSTLQECGMLTGDVLFPEQPGPLHLQELTSGDHSDSGADEMSKGQFLPPKWNSKQKLVILNYRSKEKPKVTFVCEYRLYEDAASITFRFKDFGNTGCVANSIDVIFADYVNAESPVFHSTTKSMKDFRHIYENEDDLFDLFPSLLMGYEFLTRQGKNSSSVKSSKTMSDEHLPGLGKSSNIKLGSTPSADFYETDSVVRLDSKNANNMKTICPASPTSGEPISIGHQNFHRKHPTSHLSPVSPIHPVQSTGKDWAQDGKRDFDLETPWNPASPPKHPNKLSVGSDDLHIYHPHHGIVPLQPLNPGGGMMMGPDHPVFRPGNSSPHADIFSGSGIRGARYDHIVPPVSTGTGLDPDILGGGTLQIPSSGKNKQKVPGVPNPDHLKPPSWNQGPGFI